MAQSSRIRRALIICDMQSDALPSLFSATSESCEISKNMRVDPTAKRQAFVDSVQNCLRASISNPLPDDNAIVIFLGLRFSSRYEGLHSEHCLYGSLRRLNEKVGDASAHWFMEGFPGSEIDKTLMDMVTGASNDVTNNGDDTNKCPKHVTLWRTGHLPPSSLSSHLTDNSITDVTVIGAKASQAVQSTVQYLAEHFPVIDVSVIKEALADDSEERLEALVEHLLPLYARVASTEEYVEAACGLDRYAEKLSTEKKLIAKTEENGKDSRPKPKRKNVLYYADCQRGGHFSMYVNHLTNRKSSPFKEGTSWVSHATQKWYEDVFRGKQYHCPLGRRVVDFCDEPSFSEISMFLKGRDCLDDKGKLLKLAQEFLPETYIVEGGMKGWESAESRPSELDETDTNDKQGPWFVKETNKNGGRAVQVCVHASQCLDLANNAQETYVVQRHVPNPNLLKDGRKWHFKMYNLLICESDGITWTLRSHYEAWLCAATEPWSTENVTPEVQLTIKRTKRFRDGVVMDELDADGDTEVYSKMFQKCTDIVSTIVQRAVDSGSLQGRPGQKQFEMFSTDFVFDAHFNKAYLIEFNFSPVVFDPHANQELTTVGLRLYQRLFELHGEKAEVNDHSMIKDVVSIVFFPEEAKKNAGKDGEVGSWRVIKSFSGVLHQA